MPKVVLLSVLLVATSLVAQERHAVVYPSTSLYDEVIEELFRYQRQPQDGPLTVLRYTYMDRGGREMQLSFAQTDSGTAYRVERWRPVAGAASVSQQLNKLFSASGGTLNKEAAIKAITVEHAVGLVKSDSSLGRLLSRGSSVQVPLSGLDDLVLDDVQYTISISSLNRRIEVRISGEAAGDDEMAPLIRWMSDVRREFGDVDLSVVARKP